MRSAVAVALAGLLATGGPALAGGKPTGGSPKSTGGSSKSGSSSSSSSSKSSSSSGSSKSSGSKSSTPKSSGSSASGSKSGTSKPTAYASDPWKPAPSKDKVRQLKQDKAASRERRASYRNDDGYRPYQRYSPYRYGYGSGYSSPTYGSGYGPAYYSVYGFPVIGYAAPQAAERQAGAVRLEVPQKDAAVLVDGYEAGRVADYDGSEGLYLEPGPHEIALRLDGYRTHVFRVYVPLDQTLTLRHEMVPGEGEDVADLSDWYEAEPAEAGTEGVGEVASGPAGYARLQDAVSGAQPALGVENWGRLRIDVQPDDAAVYVDGEFRGTALDLRSIKLPAGVHRVEVVRPGFGTVTRDVEVAADQVADFTVALGPS
jgi:hypothetical protein